MKFLRWISFWPLAMLAGQVATFLVAFVGLLLFRHWCWPTFFVVAASAFIQPVVVVYIASRIVPRMNGIAKFLVFAPYTLIYLSAIYTLFRIIFFSDPNLLDAEPFFSLTAWWKALAINLGFLYGISTSMALWFEREAIQDELPEQVCILPKPIQGEAAPAV